MRFIKLAAVLLLCVWVAPSYAQRAKGISLFSPAVVAGLSYGGTPIGDEVNIATEDGREFTLQMTTGSLFLGGLQLSLNASNSFGLTYAGEYQAHLIKADNGALSLTRLNHFVFPFYRTVEDFRIGVGAVWTDSIVFTEDAVVDASDQTIEFYAAPGVVVDVSYDSRYSHFLLGARFVAQEYRYRDEAETLHKLSNNHGQIYFGLNW